MGVNNDPKFSPSTSLSYCMPESLQWNESPLSRYSKCHCFRKDPPYHRDCKGFGSYAAKTFVSPTFNSCFLDSGSKHSAWEFEDWMHDIPAAQSDHVFSVGLGHWKMSQQNGLKDPSDSSANWQLWYIRCPKCSDSRHARTAAKTQFCQASFFGVSKHLCPLTTLSMMGIYVKMV